MIEVLNAAHINDLLIFLWMFAALTHAYRPRARLAACVAKGALCLSGGMGCILLQEAFFPNYGVYMLLFVCWGCVYGASALQGSFMWKTAMVSVYSCVTFHLGKVAGLINQCLPLALRQLPGTGRVLFQLFAMLSAVFLARHAVTTGRRVPAVCWGSLMCVSLIGIGYAYYQMLNERGAEKMVSAALYSVGMVAIVLTVEHLCAKLIYSHERDLVRLSIEQSSEGAASMARQASSAESELRRYRHETLNHLSTMSALLDRGETAQAKALIDEMVSAPPSVEGSASSGNLLVDAIFHQKETICRERGIALSADLVLTERLPLSDAEVSSLLGNLLNNAIEAAVGCRQPFVHARIYPARDYLCIEVVNSADAAKLRGNPALNTTKAQPDLHGIGLKVVREITESHQGMLFLDTERPGQFTARVLIHL